MNSDIPCFPFFLLWCLNKVSLFVWSKGEKHLGLICSSSSQHLFWFFFSPLSVLTLSSENFTRIFLITSFLLSSSLQFLRLLLLHSMSAEPKWISPVEFFAQGWAQCSTFPIKFVLAHDGNNRWMTPICTISDTCVCVMSWTRLLLN